MNPQLTAIIAALPVVAPFLFALYQYLITLLPANQQTRIKSVVQSAVLAAEQIYEKVPGSGAAKKAWVLATVKSLLGNKPPALIEMLIEEAVQALPDSPPQPSAPAV